MKISVKKTAIVPLTDSPVSGESIPIRLFLAGYDLTATMRDVNKKFSVRYFLNLVLVDEEDRRYFKQQVTGHVFGLENGQLIEMAINLIKVNQCAFCKHPWPSAAE